MTKKSYIFLDEIQLVENFQKAVDSLYVKQNVDIYITGSNSYLLSGELATLLLWRYVEIKMLPLSILNSMRWIFMRIKKLFFMNIWKMVDYHIFQCWKIINTYIEGIYNTIILKDIEERQRRKENDSNKRKITDISLLKNISKLLDNSIGNPISIKSISDYLISSGRKISQNTVGDYVEALIEPYIFYSVERYDVIEKNILKNNKKNVYCWFMFA